MRFTGVILAAACSLAALSPALAADVLPLKAPKLAAIGPYPTNGCGAYYGFNAIASALPIANATPGATAIGGDVGGTFGYTCALANGSSWFLEGQGDLQNLNGTGGNGFHLGGQAHFAIRGGVSGPIVSMLPSLPNLNLPAVPSLPILPQGVTVSGASQTFVYGAVNFDDISAQFGNAQARDWLISPEIGLENRTRLSNNVVGAVWAGAVLDSNPICIGGVACPRLSTGLHTGFQFLY